MSQERTLIAYIAFVLLLGMIFCGCKRTKYDFAGTSENSEQKINYDLRLDPQKPARDFHN